MLERYLIVWLSLLALVAYSWPGASIGFDPFLASVPLLPLMIAVIMFAIGWLMPRDELAQVVRRWPTVLGGTAVQYTVMPLLGYTMGRLFGFEGPLFAGIVIVGCVPGAMASNVLTLVARGNVSYSVSLTTSATLLSPLVVPLGLWLFLGASGVPMPGSVARNLVLQVVLPVLVGHLLGRGDRGWQQTGRRLAHLVANLLIIWLIAVVVGQNRGAIEHVEPRLALALLCVNLFGYLFGYLGGFPLRIDEAARRALAIEVGMQNAGLGVVLANQLFTPEAALPPAMFAFGCMMTGAMLARVWAAFPPRTHLPATANA
ncbi:MAG: bile acid:sodium symporter family protein [Pirellulales bacterium]|nr:bile acid:sodium symporter family protein [Pirellulales bacterium]